MVQSQLSPMMQHYMETKKQYPDCVLFYRLGDFYEMFFDDALTVSKELEITLTGKECGLPERAPMCGVPFHAVDSYLNRLVQKGYKVAIAEQMEDPKQAKGLVKREVIRVVTPGTITSAQALDETKNNYLMGIVCTDGGYGVSTADISTGDFLVTEVSTDRELFDEINKFSPSEIICNNAFYVSGVDIEELKNRYHVAVSALDSHFFGEESCHKVLREHFRVGSLSGLGLEDYGTGIIAAGAVLQYMYETQKSTLEHITTIKPYSTGQFMIIDTSTRRNLELVETMREKQKRGTLLWVLDKTKTAMGARLLRAYIEQPLIHREEIIARQSAVEELNMNYISREEIREYLNPVYDLERLIGRISYKTANPRDLISFCNSLEMLPYIKRLLEEFSSPLLKALADDMDPLEDLFELIRSAIVEEPPITLREGGIIRDGYNEEADKLRAAKTEGKTWLAELEAREREKTGIKGLKVKFNKVFGYYFEVTNSFKNMVPDYFVRKQTLTNAERFTTDELKQLEEIIMGAEDKLVSLEYDLFCQVRDHIASQVVRIQKTAKSIAGTDVFCSLSTVASRRNYVKPAINEKGTISIKKRTPSGGGADDAGRFVCGKRHLSGQRQEPAVRDHRPQHGRKIHLHAPGCPDRAHGPAGQLRARRRGGHRYLRPHFHPGGGLRRPGQRPEYLYGGNDRGSQYSAKRHPQQPAGSGRDRTGDQHLRRAVHRLGCDRAHQQHPSFRGQDAVRHPLPRADGAGGHHRRGEELLHRRQGAGGRYRVPAQDRPGRRGQELWNPGGQAGRGAGVGDP